MQILVKFFCMRLVVINTIAPKFIIFFIPRSFILTINSLHLHEEDSKRSFMINEFSKCYNVLNDTLYVLVVELLFHLSLYCLAVHEISFHLEIKIALHMVELLP